MGPTTLEVLGESCTTSIKDFAIFPPHPKKKKEDQYFESNNVPVKTWQEIFIVFLNKAARSELNSQYSKSSLKPNRTKS